jgi:hypothetical protein
MPMKNLAIALAVALIAASDVGSFTVGMMFKELLVYRQNDAIRQATMLNNADIFAKRQGDPMGDFIGNKIKRVK